MQNNGKYNGWANWETWSVHLWLSNDEGSNDFVESVVEEAGNVDKAADFLKGYFDDIEMCPLLGKADLYSDLLQAALDRVEWREVASAFKPDSWGESDEAPEDTDGSSEQQ